MSPYQNTLINKTCNTTETISILGLIRFWLGLFHLPALCVCYIVRVWELFIYIYGYIYMHTSIYLFIDSLIDWNARTCVGVEN